MVSSGKKYILLEIAGSQWAWPLQSSSQFFSIDYILPLPKADKNIVGLAYQHGRILTVIQADKLLANVKNSLSPKQALWFEHQQDVYALLVDAGLETVTIKTFFTDSKSKVFKKYFKYQGNKVYCLDPEQLIASLNIYDK